MTPTAPAIAARRLPAFELNSSKPGVVVVDDLFHDPHRVRQYALSLPFHRSSAHKGKRTHVQALFPGLKERFESLLGVEIRDWNAPGFNGTFQTCTAEEPLVIHSDLQRWAGVVYLTPDAPLRSGVSFYRSRETGLRLPPTDQDAAESGVSVGELERRMYHGKLFDHSAWEQTDSVANRFNRLVLWNGRLVHAAEGYFGDRPENCRLFHMFFFDEV